MNQKIADAKRILRHYMFMTMSAAGLQVNSDVYAEIDEIVDLIVTGTVEEVKADATRVFVKQFGLDDGPKGWDG